MSMKSSLAALTAALMIPAAVMAEEPVAPTAPSAAPPVAAPAPADVPPVAAPADVPPAAEAPPADVVPPETPPATPPVAETAPPVPPTPGSMRAVVGADGVVPPPPPGMGQVVFFRKNSLVGMAVWFRVRESCVELGKLTNGRYFVQIVPPGDHLFTAATETTESYPLEVDAGETYFVQASVAMGVMVGRADLSPANAQQFRAAFRGMKLADPPASTASAGAC